MQIIPSPIPAIVRKMNTKVKELKLTLEITNSETGEVLWTDWALGNTKSDNFNGMFEEAEINLGNMQRGLKFVLERDYKAEEDDLHDCHLVGGGGESGCSHPSHKQNG